MAGTKIKRTKVKTRAPAYTLNAQQIQNLKVRLTGEIIFDVYEIVLYTSMLVLRDEFGFGSKRLERFTAAALEMLKDIEAGRLDFEDCRTTVHEETGVGVDFKTGVRRIV